RILPEELGDALSEQGVDAAQLQRGTELEPSPEAKQLAAAFEKQSEPLLAGLRQLQRVDSAPLQKRAERLERRLRKDFEKLTEAIERQVDGSLKERRQLVRQALKELWPEGKPAERQRSVLYYLDRFGFQVLDAIAEVYDPYDARECLLLLPEKQLLERQTPR
ncbi:MAG: bacillithiol biosynthesis BshC, partial [Planctomycetota bacterium]